MSEYTAADFEKARFAEHEDGSVASRSKGGGFEYVWTTVDMRELTDEDMAEGGWTPVREANGRRDRNSYVDHIQEQDRIIRQRNERIESLSHERDVLAYELADAQAPLSIDSLAAAYEAAEVPTDDNPIREGDVVIYTSACGTGVTVHKAAVGQFGRETHGYVRILSRAPREPWQDLADVLDTYRPTPDEMLGWGDDHLAAYLHERGVRVTGGDES